MWKGQTIHGFEISVNLKNIMFYIKIQTQEKIGGQSFNILWRVWF